MMKTTPLFLLLVCLLPVGGPGFAYTAGDGSETSPYRIATAADLLELAGTPGDYASHFILTADIDLDGEGPFDGALIAPDTDPATDGFQGPAFNGVFDGGEHVIRNLTIEPAEGADFLGLFGGAGVYPGEAAVFDLGLEQVSILGSSGHACVGGLAGQFEYGEIDRCYVIADIHLGTGASQVGGLIGRCVSGDVSDCYARGAVTCGQEAQKVGGLVGACSNVQFRHNYAAALVGAGTGSTLVGGFIGSNDGFFTDQANFWDTDVSGQTDGMVGTGLASVEMFNRAAFMDAGWDFAGETANGTGDVWKSPTRSWPMLSWQDYAIGTAELVRLADAWLTDSSDAALVYPADFWQDGAVDMMDLQMLSRSWRGGQLLTGFAPIVDGFETGDFSALDWSMAGPINWQASAEAPYEGTYAALITGLPAGNFSQLGLAVDAGEGRIGFWYHITGGRSLLFSIDGATVGMLGATAGWTWAEFDLTEGPHTCTWLFYSMFGGSVTDTARLDGVRVAAGD